MHLIVLYTCTRTQSRRLWLAGYVVENNLLLLHQPCQQIFSINQGEAIDRLKSDPA